METSVTELAPKKGETSEQFELRIRAEEAAIMELEMNVETDDLFDDLDAAAAQQQPTPVEDVPVVKAKTGKKRGSYKKREKKKPPPVVQEESFSEFLDAPEPIAAKRPPKKRKLTKAPKASKKDLEEQEAFTEIRKNPTYKLLAAYGRSAVISPVLQAQGYDLTPVSLRKISPSLYPQFLDEVEEILEHQGTTALGNAATAQVLEYMEKEISKRTRYKIDGTTAKCFENQQWVFLLERAKLRMGIGVDKMPPQVEFALITAQIAFFQHEKNKLKFAVPATDLEAEAPDITATADEYPEFPDHDNLTEHSA